MKLDHVIVQSPATPASQLFLLYHGVGDNPVAMAESGRWFADTFPQAWVVSVGGPEPCGAEPGRQWFSTHGITEENRQQRVDAAMPTFIASVQYWQQRSGVKPAATALIGFSQGSIMILEGLKADPALAGRVIAFSGRYATLPRDASTLTTLHLIHGAGDTVISAEHARQAAEHVMALGGDVTLDIVDDLAHSIDQRGINLALNHLRFTVPRRYFDEALSGAKPGADDVITLM